MKLFFFDTETTGLDSDDQILQFGGIYWSFDGKEFTEERRINQYINVTKDIHPEAERVHGIKKNMIDKFWYIDEYIDEILWYIKKADYVIGHNLDFDIKMLKQECKRIGKGFDRDNVKSICTMKKSIDILNLPWGKRPKLSELYKHLFGKDFDDAHNAMADVEATKDCFIELVKNGGIIIKEQKNNDKKTKTKEDNLEHLNNLIDSYREEWMAHFSWINQENIDIKDENWYTALSYASLLWIEEIVELLLKNWADIETMDEDWNTILIQSCRRWNIEITKLLLENWANIEAKNKNWCTALMCATLKLHKEIVELLLTYWADINILKTDWDIALLLASIEGKNKTIKQQLENWVNIETYKIEWYTPLIYASRKWHKKTIELLLNNWANIDNQDFNWYTALIWASLEWKKEIVKQLIENWANIDIKDIYWWTALTHACSEWREEIVKILLSNWADINTKDIFWTSALAHACCSWQKEVVDFLLANWVDIDPENLHELNRK